MGVESSEDMKLRLYSPDEYESELAGDGIALGDGGFVLSQGLQVVGRGVARL
jgi:hypothetical protein